MSSAYHLPIGAEYFQLNPTWLAQPAWKARETHADAAEFDPQVWLPVAHNSRIYAVTAGRIESVTPIAGGLYSTPRVKVVLFGNDGASYTYSAVAEDTYIKAGAKVTKGQVIGRSAAGGLGFSISVPDTTQKVSVREALKDWQLGMSPSVDALPTQTNSAPDPTSKKTRVEHVVVISDTSSRQAGVSVAKTLRSRKVKTTSVVVPADDTPDQLALAIRRAATITPATDADGNRTPARYANLVVSALSATAPAKTAALADRLPKDLPVLWVQSPATAIQPKGAVKDASAAGGYTYPADAYAKTLGEHPNFRVETLPGVLRALVKASTGTTWSKTLSSVVSTMAASYASEAYQLPEASAAVTTVLAYAEAQLGKPYVWAGAGPNVFDCSGLTMQAFRRVGFDFVHNAYAQYEATKAEQVSVADLQPGDLVFFGPDEAGIHHVGIYVGDGNMINAPHTGTDVQVESMQGFGFYAATDPLAAVGGVQSFQASGTSTATSTIQAFAQTLTTAEWNAAQWPYLLKLWDRESGWNYQATNASSGAYGIAQALPADKMASAGADWETDPYTQVLWGLGYIKERYGSPQAAWAHELSHGWY